MATVRDIAKEAGVSVGTASRALTGNGYVSEQNRALVLKVAEKLGYVPKEAPPKSRAVAVVLPDIIFPFMSAFLKYVEFELSGLGYKTFVLNTLSVQGRVEFVIDLLKRGELDGVIINADVTEEQFKALKKYPLISFEKVFDEKAPLAASDHIAGGKLAGETLLSGGCRDVLILTTKHIVPVFADQRIEVCKQYLLERGVRCTVAELDNKFLTFKYAPDVVNEFFSLYPNVDGIFADDVTAYCFAAEAVRRGIKIPERLKILGYDGNDITRLNYPRITTIVQDIPLIAAKCVELLLKRIEGEPVEAQTLIPVRLQKGDTI